MSACCARSSRLTRRRPAKEKGAVVPAAYVGATGRAQPDAGFFQDGQSTRALSCRLRDVYRSLRLAWLFRTVAAPPLRSILQLDPENSERTGRRQMVLEHR